MKKSVFSLLVIIFFISYTFQSKFHGQFFPKDNNNFKPESDQNKKNDNKILPEKNISTQRIGKFKNGEYLGDAADAFYGTIQVQAIIINGKLTDIKFIQYPKDRNRSIEINSFAMPVLRQEAISIQDANVDTVSGATYSSQAFIQSLSTALAKAI